MWSRLIKIILTDVKNIKLHLMQFDNIYLAQRILDSFPRRVKKKTLRNFYFIIRGKLSMIQNEK